MKKSVVAAAALAFTLFCANAQNVKQTEVEESVIVTTEFSDGTTETRTLSEEEYIDESGTIRSKISEEEKHPVGIAARYSHFVWGLQTGISCDLSGLDQSTFNFDILCGYRNKWFQTIGVGAGVHKALGNSDTFLPIYFLLRTSFRPKPSLVFFHLRLGYNFNTIADSPVFGDTSAGIGCGVNLFRKRKCQGFLLLEYNYRHYNQRHTEMTGLSRSNVSLAQIAFGITF